MPSGWALASHPHGSFLWASLALSRSPRVSVTERKENNASQVSHRLVVHTGPSPVVATATDFASSYEDAVGEGDGWPGTGVTAEKPQCAGRQRNESGAGCRARDVVNDVHSWSQLPCEEGERRWTRQGEGPR